MLTLHTAYLGEPSLIAGTDLRVTYAGLDKPSLVERLLGERVAQAYVVAPNLPVFIPRPYDVTCREWTVTFEPDPENGRALVHVLLGDGTREPRW